MKLSIIIPVYNGEKWIDQCYQSMVRQTCNDWEAIFVDDGSSDKSGCLLDGICDTRVKVIHTSNAGVAVAREIGLLHANGDIVTFLDVDDSLSENACVTFIAPFVDNAIDIVIGGVVLLDDNHKRVNEIKYEPAVLSADSVLGLACQGKVRWQLWGKAYRKQLFENIKTPTGLRNGEDMAVFMQALSHASTVMIIPNKLYYYYQIPTSVTHAKAKIVSIDGIKAAAFTQDVMGKRLGELNVACLFLLMASAALRSGLDMNNEYLREVLRRYFSLKAISQLPVHKSISLIFAKYMRFNFAKFI